MIKVTVIRPNTPYVPGDLDDTCKTLVKTTTYKQRSFQELAPSVTDCLTAFAYIYRKSIQLNLDWIGNMPRTLMFKWHCKLISRDMSQLRPGDVLFLRGKTSARLVTHVAVVTKDPLAIESSSSSASASIESNPNPVSSTTSSKPKSPTVFHSSKEANGGKLEPLHELMNRYESPDVLDLYTYVDPRGEEKPKQEAASLKRVSSWYGESNSKTSTLTRTKSDGDLRILDILRGGESDA